MNTRAFGRDKIAISEVGLGCWQFGGNWGEMSVETAKSILWASLESGVAFLDTADVYGNGKSEEIIGSFLAEVNRDDVFVATKVGRKEVYPDKYSEYSIRNKIEESIQRLGIDALDLVQTHCVPTEIMRSGEIYEWLEKLVEAGKIKRFGASVESVEEGLMLIEQVPSLYSLQVIFNIFRQKPLEGLFPRAQEAGVGIIARVPLASGALSGKFTKASTFGESDHRNFNRDGAFFNVGETFAGVPFAKAIEFADELKELAPEGMRLSEMALRWILDSEAVSVVIPGASSEEQAVSNARVSELPRLDEKLVRAIREMYRDRISQFVRGVY